jgi:fatty-acyl-CoA synthase
MTELRHGLTFAGLMMRALGHWGDRTAFSGHGGDFTYAQALNLFARFQAVYAARGLVRGQRIALLSANRGDSWLAAIAAQGLGLCTTNLHPLGSLEDHLFILEDAEIDHLVVDSHAYADISGELATRASQKTCFSLGPTNYAINLAAAADAVGAASPQILAQPSDDAALSYTGGTTGKSKGALRQHPSNVAMVNAIMADFELPNCPTYLSVAPMSHVGGTKMPPTLIRGGRVHFHHGFDPERILRDIEVERIDTTLLVPTMIYLLLDNSGLSKADLSSLQLLIYGASPMSPTRLVEGLERIGPVFSQLYGQT